MARIYQWDFPLPRTHAGMLQGNGTMGVMIWGEGSVLRLTIGRGFLGSPGRVAPARGR